MKTRILNYSIMGLICACMVFLPACTSDNEPGVIIPNDREDIMLDVNTRAAAENLKNFYVDFTTDVVSYIDSDTDIVNKNAVVSPLSVSMVLAMAANSTEDGLRKEIMDYLGAEDIAALNSLSRIMLDRLPLADNQTNLSIANSIWANDSYKLNGDFIKLMTSDYLATVKERNFSDGSAKTVKEINSWCSDNTNGLIRNMIDEIPPFSLAIMLNAVYFKGIWKDRLFLLENTRKAPFYGVNGTREVDMMSSKFIDRKYSANDNFEVFSLDFGNTSFSLMIVLPNESLSPEEANKLLNPEELSELENDAVMCKLSVQLPKFKVDAKLDMNKVLASGGIHNIGGENLFNMFDPATSGTIRFRHATQFEIDESGAKAASVSSGEIGVTAPEIKPGESYTVKVDRPFYFFLKENSTGACLLSGRIVDL